MNEPAGDQAEAPDKWRAHKMVAGLAVALAVRWLCGGTGLTGWPLMIVLLAGAFWEPLLTFAWTLKDWHKIGKEGIERREEQFQLLVSAGHQHVDADERLQSTQERLTGEEADGVDEEISHG